MGLFSDAKEALSDKQLQENMFQKSKMSEINMWIVMSKNVKKKKQNKKHLTVITCNIKILSVL